MRRNPCHWALVAVLLLGGRAALGHSQAGSGGTQGDGSGSSRERGMRNSDAGISFYGCMCGCGTGSLSGSAPTDDPARNLARQPGVVPYPLAFRLVPGETRRVALFCTDLFAHTPDDRTRLVTTGDEGLARRADGGAMKLREALEQNMLQIRGRGSADPPRPADEAYYDAFVTNQSDQILSVELSGGTLLTPVGQPTPRLPAGFRRILAAAASSPGASRDMLAYAVWAARGFSRADIEETMLRRIMDQEALLVQRWLDYAFVPRRFDRGSEGYDRVHRRLAQTLGRALPFNGTAELATGDRVQVEGLVARDGHALVTLHLAQNGGRWQYRARIAGQQSGKIALALRHLRTGQPIEAQDGRVWVTPTPSMSW
jgi:hypothetical protein